MTYYLGIDGGGTKTTCAVADESRLLATATAGPSNPVRVGGERARASLQESVRAACSAAGIVPDQVVRTCVGVAGAARPELAKSVHDFLAEILPSAIDVVTDVEIALEAAFGEGPGVIVVAGTGSIAYGRDRQGNTARAGGWGFAIGDEGSAYWIGRAAVSAVLRASDRNYGSASNLLHSNFASALCKAWGVTTLADLARMANAIPPPDFAALFPAVAASQDELAFQIMSSAGLELAQIAAVVVRRLFPEQQTESVAVGMIGGVFRHSDLTRGIFYGELYRLDPRVSIYPHVIDPVGGALRIARRGAANHT